MRATPGLRSIRPGLSTAAATELPWREAAVFVALAGVGALLEFAVLPLLTEGTQSFRFVEHIVVTLFAATALGVTYELGLYQHRKRVLRTTLEEYGSAVLQAMGKITPREIFGLLNDVASSPELIPTLYDPPRSNAEYNFVGDLTFFSDLMPVARPEIVAILRGWLTEGSHRNVRFLATDFIGYYELRELSEELKTRADKKLKNWERVPHDDRPWVLNAWWAASRCEHPRYESLAKLLATTDHADIQEWILFVPRQMQDQELVPMIDRFLAKNRHIAQSAVGPVAMALAALRDARLDAVGVIAAHRSFFADPERRAALEAAWLDYRLDLSEVANALGP